MTMKIKMVVLVITALVGIASLASYSQFEMSKVYEKANFANENSVPALVALSDALNSAQAMRGLLWRHIVTKDKGTKESIEESMNAERKKIDAALAEYEPTIVDEEDRAMLGTERAALLEYETMKEKVLALSKLNKMEEAIELRLANQKIFARVVDAFQKHNDYNVALAKKGAKEAIDTKNFATMLSTIISLIIFCLISGIGFYIARNILNQIGGEPAIAVAMANKMAIGDFSSTIELQTGDSSSMMAAMNGLSKAIQAYIKETTDVLTAMVEGNLDVEIMGDFKGDFIELKNSINKIIITFNQILNEITNSASEILVSSNSLSESSSSLAQGSSEQASSTEEITSALSQIEAQARQNAESALTTNEASKKVNESANIGNSEMMNLLKAMEELNVSSEKISKVVKEIESIAFQTNILALNAAVEAARAGQHGKGFNVVATEVRNLAIRSSNSAKETSNMVEETIKQISLSSKMAQNTSSSLHIIAEGIAKVNSLIESIALSSREQTAGITQVNIGVSDISKIVMSNSAASEEMAAASEELSGRAKSFKNMVSNFKIKDLQEKNYIVKKNDQPFKRISL